MMIKRYLEKLTLFSTTQLCQRHNLNNKELFKVMYNGEAVERVNTKKILGIYFVENLSWSYHVNNAIQSSYETLRSLRQFKLFPPYKVGKSLAEILIISKIRYCLLVYSQLPKHQTQRLQKSQNRIGGLLYCKLMFLSYTRPKLAKILAYKTASIKKNNYKR